MNKSFRLVLILIFAIATGAGVFQARLERARLLAELDSKVRILSLGIEDAVEHNLALRRPMVLSRILRQFSENEALAAIVICSEGRTVASTATSPELGALCVSHDPNDKVRSINSENHVVHSKGLSVDGRSYDLVLVHSLREVEKRARSAFFHALFVTLLTGLLVLALLEALTRWLLRRSMRYLIDWMRGIFRGSQARAGSLREVNQRLPQEFSELTRELSTLALRLRRERSRVNRRRGPESEDEPAFDLRGKVQRALRGRQLIVVANREPYSHESRENSVVIQRPASGVVTALEPIMRLCGGGIWVGHGSGSADRQAVDANDEVAVPPELPTYTLRRVWLTSEEENGYYYGFANEGLWPLCHLAYTRPTFRLNDWEMYKRVNEKFRDAALARTDAANAVILVQDYHFALLPKLIREAVPKASVELFWHIPWPNPEAFGICPQYLELLEGMLGADVIGFHTQFHCNNFLETCDRYLECRVDWERFSVTIGSRETLVRSYPISIATEPVPQLTPDKREALRKRYGISSEYVALGVDRLDYTKGLVERFAGVERFLEKYPQFVGRFSFVEMGTPSRTNITSYRVLIDEVEAAVARVNARFKINEDMAPPIILLKGHFDLREVSDFYKLGQVCLVTSLHDGMNLVAKEYVWSQDAEQGALILSRFTGAARELSEALIVNPYSSEEIADALYQAFTLTREQRCERMLRMKRKLQSHNAFHWATDLLAGVS